MIRRLFVALAACACALSASAQSSSFTPFSTVCATLTGSAQSVTLPTAPPVSGLVKMLVTSYSTVAVYWRTDGVAVTTGTGTPALPTSQALFSVPANAATASVIGAGTGDTFCFTAGATQ